MIVYGDPARDERLDALACDLAHEAERLAGGVPTVEQAREILIRAGELEQAVYDDVEAGSADPAYAEARLKARAATTEAAALFERAASGAADDVLRAAARRLSAAADALPARAAFVRVKVPEGFAFYGLFPDVYRSAARRWAAARRAPGGRDALVLGIRSIGTTLSAVAAEAIRSVGWGARRVTVRPVGHPYRRAAHGTVLGADFGLVVDEGPGLSGSSMMAGAELLARSGVGDIALLCAHSNGPGAAASPSLRARWNRSSVYPAVDDQASAWLASTLARAASTERRDDPGATMVEDVGSGHWRRLVYDDERAWPDVVTALERPKLLVHTPDGRRLLFKFGGLCPAPRHAGVPQSLASWLADRVSRQALEGAAWPRTTAVHGFLTREWVDGRPLKAEDADPSLLSSIGAYAARASDPPLTPDERASAEDRVARMVSVNVEEALGPEAAEGAVERVRRAHREAEGWAAYGDGRMAPHEWIRTPDGRVRKTDVEGHVLDHTWVGPQPVLWDLAAIASEWRLDPAGVRSVLDGYEAAGGRPVPADMLDGFVLAYAAHRAGQAGLFASTERDAAERSRMERSFEHWRARLATILDAPVERCA